MIYQRLIDLDALFENRRGKVIIANNLDILSAEGKKKLQDLVYQHYEGDALSAAPHCGCPDPEVNGLSGAQFRYVVCPKCKERCLYDVDRPLEAVLWMEAPDGVRALINPYAWVTLSQLATSSGFNALEWMCNKRYRPSAPAPKRLDKLEFWMNKQGIDRSLNAFHDNFDELMDYCLKIKIIKESGPSRNDTRRWIEMFRDKIFTRHVPMPSKVCFVTESSNDTTFVDKTIFKATNALLNIVSINNSIRPVNVHDRQRRVVEATTLLGAYHKEFIEKTVGSKYGLARKHAFGGRVYFSARSVITSISERHKYDEIYTPWSLSLQLFRAHLTSKLLWKFKMSPVEIDHLFRESALKYNPLLHELMNELIAESPTGRIPVTFQRNPTLARQSAQLLWIPKIKTDPTDNTISFSILAIKGPNADYDGDEMNLMLVLDYRMLAKLSRLAPHLGVLDLNRPRQISSVLDMPAPALSTAFRWMYYRKRQEALRQQQQAA